MQLKSRIILVLAVCFSFSAMAQISPITFGPLAGFTQNQLIADKATYKESAKAGLQGGLFVRLSIAKFILQPEAYIGLKRGDVEFSYKPNGTGNDVQGTQSLALTTLDVPLMVGWELLDAKVIKLRAMAGPVAGIVLNNNVDISTQSGITSDIPQTDLIDLRDDAVWAAQAGLGVDILKFTVDVRYQFGISDIAVNQDLSNNLFHFAVGFKIL